jgi:P4 family phage/plasmid primase-like protien
MAAETRTSPQKLSPVLGPIQATNLIMSSDQYIGSSLHRFLEDRRVWKKAPGQDVSMTGMGANKGNWYVSDDDYSQFMDLMHEWLFVKDLRPNNFVEQRKPDGVTPLLIDLDFAYPPEKNLERTFTKENIQIFVAEAAAVLKENFDLKDRQNVRFFVTLRPNPYPNKGTSKHIKDGIHILCPDITLPPEFQALVRHLMLEREAVKKSFGETGYINRDDIVFDESLTKKQGWLFYGESKPDIPPYTLKHVFKYAPKTEKMTESKDTYKPRELIELLSIRHKLHPTVSLLESRKDVVKDVLAKMASPAAHNQLVQQHTTASQEEVTGYLPILMDSFNNIVSTEDEITLSKRLAVECLSEERASGYDSWMRVGWCMRNIDSSESMFDAWMDFSNKCGKSTGNNVEQLRKDWIRGSMRHVNGSPGLKMGSLKMWAREDNPTRYMEIMDGDIISFIQKTAITFRGGTHYHVAKMIHKLYPDVYKCFVDGRTTEWYEFKDHVWHPMPSGILIKTTITDDLTLKVDSARRSLKGPHDKDEDYDELMKKYQENIVKLLKLQENLYNANFKDSVMKEAAQIFYDPDFHKHLDQNVYVLGCSNGILNLREPVFDDQGRPMRYKPTLRPGTAQDYVSLQSGVTPDGLDPIPYIPYDSNDPVQTEIMDFFKKIFPADDLREYVLTLAAGCLEAANKEQCFYIMTGSGGNGKSKFVELMCSVLGQYAGSLATTALTRKRPDSGAANPDVMSVKNARFIEMKEPDEGEPINSARMKQFSGEDLVEARGLFKDQERFKIRGKIFMACNRLPPMHSMDGGTWRRIRVIPFDSRFLATEDPMIDPSRNIYPRDDMMDEKLKSWRVPFFSLLVHYYETKYCPHGIKKTPSIVLQACENYKGNFDSFGKFIKGRIRKVIGYDDPPQFKDMWKAYKNWHMEQNATGKKLTENELRIRLNELYQAPADGKTYLHLRLFYSDEEAEEFDKELADGTSASNC